MKNNRKLPLRAIAALMTLAAAGCTADLADTPAPTGNVLTLDNVQIGAHTRAEALESDGFADGDRLEATLALGQTATQATYVYNAGTWSAEGTPAYWQNTTDAHALTLRTPSPEPAMPAAFTADNWHAYDELVYNGTSVRPGTTSFTLSHARAQLCVVLTPGTGMADDELATATVVLPDGTTLWHNTAQGAHYALCPADNTRLQGLTITVNGNSYTYTNDDPATATFIANRCIMLTLRVNKAGVESLGVTSAGWQQVSGSVTADNTLTTIDIPTPGTLQATWGTQIIAQARITGALNGDDLYWLGKTVNDQLTTLWIEATCNNDNAIPGGFARNDRYDQNPDSELKTIILPHVTSIGSHAFRSYPNLANLYLPNVATIGSYAFMSDTGLRSLSLPEATSIDQLAFHGCPLDGGVYLPKVQTLANQVFQNHRIPYLSLPEVRTIGAMCFYNENSIPHPLKVVYMPKVESIEGSAFGKCGQINTVIINGARDGQFFLPAAPANPFALQDTTRNLLLCEVDEEMFTANQAAYTGWAGEAWTDVYYDLRPGADPEDPASYAGHWSAQ